MYKEISTITNDLPLMQGDTRISVDLTPEDMKRIKELGDDRYGTSIVTVIIRLAISDAYTHWECPDQIELEFMRNRLNTIMDPKEFLSSYTNNADQETDMYGE